MHQKELVNKIYQLLNKTPYLIVRNYHKGDIIANYIVNRNMIYCMLSGEADLIKSMKSGEDMLLERYEKYDIFGDGFHPIELNNEYSVIAKADCSLFLFDYNLMLNLKKSGEITTCLFELAQYKLKNVNQRNELLNQKSIREKILEYFNGLAKKSVHKEFVLPLTYKELAIYLNVDRSAMTREISLLVQDNFIEKNKRKIKMKF